MAMQRSFTFRIPDKLRARLEEHAAKRNSTPARLCRELVEAGLDELDQDREPALTRPEGVRILDTLEGVCDRASDGEKLDQVLAIVRRILAGLLFHEGTFLLPELSKGALARAQKESLESLEKFIEEGTKKKPWVD